MKSVTLYTKTYCAYSKKAKALLGELGIGFDDNDVTEDEGRFAEMVERTGGGTTVPQIFISGRHIGGCEELFAMYERGELESLRDGEGAAASP